VFSPVWSKTGHSLLASIRSASNEDQWLLSFDPETGTKRVVNHEHDDTWVLNDDDAPSVSLLEYGFFDEGRKVWFVSEHTGFRHLYAVPLEGGSAQALTQGNYELWNAKLSGRADVLLSLQPGWTWSYLYALPAGGGTPQKMTSEVGNHQ
jgi:Tol biopolymer transport system component